MSRASSQVSQNVDNFLSEKSSTRLHKPPGGSSTAGSLIYGGGGCDESPFVGHQRRGSVTRPKEEAPEQANPYPTKDFRRGSGGYHQQSASGPYPGYQQQSASGPYPGYQQQPAQQQQQHQQSTSGPYPGYQQQSAQGQQQYSTGYQQQQQQQQQQQYGGGAAGGRQMSSNSYATGTNQNAGNVLTERRITRIHAPPGGQSSITFG